LQGAPHIYDISKLRVKGSTSVCVVFSGKQSIRTAKDCIAVIGTAFPQVAGSVFGIITMLSADCDQSRDFTVVALGTLK
jgi:hypothetical protein